MIIKLLRSSGAVVLSLVLAFALIVAVEGFGAVVHPFPPGVDQTDMEVCKAHVAKCPQWVLAVVVVAWGGIAFLGAWLATRLGTHRHPAHGIIVGALLFLAVAFNLYLLPYSLWFEITTPIVIPLAIIWANKLASGPALADKNPE